MILPRDSGDLATYQETNQIEVFSNRDCIAWFISQCDIKLFKQAFLQASKGIDYIGVFDKCSGKRTSVLVGSKVPVLSVLECCGFQLTCRRTFRALFCLMQCLYVKVELQDKRD
jgi:hypothetical protein